MPAEFSYEQLELPEKVIPVERFRSDVEFLRDFFSQKEPKEVVVRSRKVFQLLYGFADASGTGFGSSMVSRTGVRLRVGVWGVDEDSEETSNWKEFQNSVEALEAEGLDGNLDQSLVFLNLSIRNLTLPESYFLNPMFLKPMSIL